MNSSFVASGDLFPPVHRGPGIGVVCGPTSFNSLMETSSHLSEAEVASTVRDGVVAGVMADGQVDSQVDAEVEFLGGGGGFFPKCYLIIGLRLMDVRMSIVVLIVTIVVGVIFALHGVEIGSVPAVLRG